MRKPVTKQEKKEMKQRRNLRKNPRGRSHSQILNKADSDDR